MADLTKLSDADLAALASGDLTKVSDEGLQILAGSAQAAPQAPNRQSMTVMDKVLDSPIGGAIRGARDVVDGGAQLLTRGLEAAMPAGSSAEAYFRAERQRVEDINRRAEQDYQQNWRRGQMQGIDTGRIVGNVAAGLPLTGPLAVAGPGGLAVRGALSGMVGGAMQPVQNAGDDYWGQKGVQTAVGGVAGAAGNVAANRLATLIQGPSRAAQGASTQGTVGGGNAQAQASVTANPTASVSGGGPTLGRVGPDPSAGLSEAQRRVLERGQQLGYRATPGQASGSRSLQQMEARMESSPFFSGPFNAVKANNQTVLNRTAANAIGETADTLDSAVLGRATERLGQVFDDIGNNVPRVVPQDNVVARLASIEQQFDGLLPGPLLNNPLVQQFVNLTARGEMTGAQLRNLSSKLGKAANNQMTSTGGDRLLGEALNHVKDVVDDVLGESLDPATRAAYDAARQQYRTLMLLTQRQNVVNAGSGNVSGPNLAAALQAKDRAGYLYGRNTSDLYDAARFAQTFKPIVGDSGTATRTMEMTPWSALLSLPTRATAGAYLSQPSINFSQRVGQGLAPNAAGDAMANMLRRGGAPVGAPLVTGGLLGN